MANTYKILRRQKFSKGDYSIVPIRLDDRYDIMKWRNEQIYHLRQNQPLTKDDQDKYFNTIIAGLFEQDHPDQIIFSFLEGEKCIGYGGLVHINWIDRNAEISFIMDSAFEKEKFELHWSIFLKLIEMVAYDEINLHKIFTYAFDLRPEIYGILENNHLKKEAVLKEHCYFEGNYIDVIIHSKLFASNKKSNEYGSV